MSVLFEVWRRTVPETAVDRYRDIRRNLEALGKDGLIPSTVSRAADVGYGSGGGTVALADLFPKAIVTAIDNASSQQLHMQYLRRDLPRWSGRIEAIEEDVRIAAQKHGAHDLVLASRPNMVDPGKSTTWEEDSVFIARNFVALAEMAEPQSGKILVGYNSDEDPGALLELAKRVDAGKLFGQLVRYGVKNGDDWLVLSGVKPEILEKAKTDPKILLTDIGRKIPTTEELKNLWKP